MDGWMDGWIDEWMDRWNVQDWFMDPQILTVASWTNSNVADVGMQ
jgi:hypothetical protein